jgi:hypothetical protein
MWPKRNCAFEQPHLALGMGISPDLTCRLPGGRWAQSSSNAWISKASFEKLVKSKFNKTITPK